MLRNAFENLATETMQGEIKTVAEAFSQWVQENQDWTEVLETIRDRGDYPIPESQIETLTPQKDGLTNSELRASPLNANVTIADEQVSTLTPQKNALTNNELRENPVVVSTGITQPTTPSDTQPISAVSLPLPSGAATQANQLPNNHDVTVSNHPTEFPLPTSQISTLTPQKDCLTDSELRAFPIDVLTLENGEWSYLAGVSGSVNVMGRVTQITAVSGEAGASMSINGGPTITLPGLSGFSVNPKGNLVDPTVVFTNTVSYFIEVVS